MKTAFMFLMLFSLNASAETYLAPAIGILATPLSSGQPGTESTTTLGLEGMYIYDLYMGGLQYSHYSGVNEGSDLIGVKSKFDQLAVQLGIKFIHSEIAPYFLLGAGPIFQSVTTKIMGAEETFTSTVFGYNVGVGLLVQFSKNWAGDIAIHYYPQNILNGINYMLSVGYYL